MSESASSSSPAVTPTPHEPSPAVSSSVIESTENSGDQVSNDNDLYSTRDGDSPESSHEQKSAEQSSFLQGEDQSLKKDDERSRSRPDVPEHSRPPSAGNNTSKKEQSYLVRKIKWFDNNFSMLRETPILMQNENGPCPLIAVVNTLLLTSPPMEETSLYRAVNGQKTVQSERLLQELAELLLEKGQAQQEENETDQQQGRSYNFIVEDVLTILPSLNTGLNIDPRFDGTFQDSRAVALFQAFDVDLVHGWIPEDADSLVGKALNRAGSYDSAQSVLLEAQQIQHSLEDKRKNKSANSAFTDKEKQILEDANLIEGFLYQTATQLTPAGLNFLGDLLSAGSFAVLFRNNHFSTIYKHNDSGQLFVLVTDAGFASHPQIVWESLSDVLGSWSEFFNGQFEPADMAAPVSEQESGSEVKKLPSMIDPPIAADSDFLMAQRLQAQEDARMAAEEQGGLDDRAANRRRQSQPQEGSRRTGTTRTVTPAVGTGHKKQLSGKHASAGSKKNKKDACIIQ